ncbi:uncharacterized protein CC84DRAFT_1168214 [Paraphaeosphaeria sporulosa]|uniref:DUF4419 domain-containing protein n=1 Tax=Paraphaeosphaeria sporulosa TaxID=1460663 RepID=A0A177C058_9PLEO|nr:uncharacterized protein CC84DRAFT_1168214 [Paraphaeosphaeria sporulosa]OAG01023.1 hypothetical protein CC84DRAFT_1168214 [Paraphaeosphaeria sporulosa]
MPITVAIAKHDANAINTSNWDWRRMNNHEELLPHSEKNKSKGVLQSSVLPNEYFPKHIASSTNGLVWAAYYAYSDHHNLTLRPEDIWFAIISQLSFYINAHAEELRYLFVTHEERKELIVHTEGSINTIDFARIAKEVANMIQENVERADLQEWIMPSFSTTTESDRAVASVLFMGAMQKYFSYGACLSCGIPSVTLLGKREDWENILQRLDTLPEFGAEPAAFADGLRPVLQGFIATFDGERTPETLDFWGRIAHRTFGGSGPTYLSGWITAFCFWDADGKPISKRGWSEDLGAPACEVDFKDVPNGYAIVPLTINDNGKEYLTQMVAGSFGMEAFSQQKVKDTPDGHATTEDNSTTDSKTSNDGIRDEDPDSALDSIKPLTGWMMYHTNTFEDGHIKNLQPVADGSANRIDRTL